MLHFLCANILILITLTATTINSEKPTPLRKSVLKCKEYGKLVYENELSPVLRIGTSYNVVSSCTIVETPLIVGGVKAKTAEFPHMAAIGFGKDEDVSWQCGGTIISESYILTAAHCLESYDKGPATRVRVGTNNLLYPDKTMQERNVACKIKHPGYHPPGKYNDLALLKLDEPLTLNSRVRPACLETEFDVSDKSIIACGFGRTSYESAESSFDLMKVQLDHVSAEMCRKSYKLDAGTRFMPDGLISSMICAGVMEGGRDTCQGDSGGPLQRILSDPYCTYSVVGVTSFGKFCAFKDSPGIYTRVSSYLDWIENIVWP